MRDELRGERYDGREGMEEREERMVKEEGGQDGEGEGRKVRERMRVMRKGMKGWRVRAEEVENGGSRGWKKGGRRGRTKDEETKK